MNVGSAFNQPNEGWMLQMQGQKPLTFLKLAAANDRELSDNKSELLNGLLESPVTKDLP